MESHVQFQLIIMFYVSASQVRLNNHCFYYQVSCFIHLLSKVESLAFDFPLNCAVHVFFLNDGYNSLGLEKGSVEMAVRCRLNLEGVYFLWFSHSCLHLCQKLWQAQELKELQCQCLWNFIAQHSRVPLHTVDLQTKAKLFCKNKLL